jgi:hypothetical protein
MLAIAVAPPQRHENLVVFPLIGEGPPELPYTLLADALTAGTLTITEVGAGTVPTLLAANKAGADVLILDGEQLIGARQNRMTNRSILLPARSEVPLPVSCMEQGRWHFTTGEMSPAPQHSPSKVRRHARRAEAGYALHDLDVPTSALAEAQGNVWSEIDGVVRCMPGRSPTGALDAAYAGAAERIVDRVDHFPNLPGQVGILAFLDGAPLGLDIIGGANLFARLHDRLLRGYIMDAMSTPPASPEPAAPDAAAAQHFLDRVRQARRVAAETVGGGRYAVLVGDVVGGDLTAADRPVHLCAFPAAEPSPGHGPGGSPRPDHPLPPPSRRRRMY